MTKFTLTLDASQINEFQTCNLAWWYTYKENLRLAGANTEAMDKGTLIHNLCDLYYSYRWLDPNGNKLLQADEAVRFFKETCTTQSLFPEDKNNELERFITDRFALYVTRYMFNDFVLPNTKTSPVELGFSKLLYEDEYVRFIVEGRIDLVTVILGDKLCFVDHKTQGRDTTMYQYRPQFKTYAWATGYEYGLINYIGLQKEPVKNGGSFKRQLINFPKWMIDEWEQKLLKIFWNITAILNNPNIDAEKTIYEYRNDSACEGQYGHPCAFTSLCETGDWNMKQSLKQFKYNKVDSWSPWTLKEEVKK